MLPVGFSWLFIKLRGLFILSLLEFFILKYEFLYFKYINRIFIFI